MQRCREHPAGETTDGFLLPRHARVVGTAWRLAGQNLRPLASSSEHNFKCDVWLTSASVTLADGSFLPSRLVTIHRSMVLGQAFHERLELRNCANRTLEFQLELELASDYLDMMEIRGLHRKTRGQYLPVQCDGRQAQFAYQGTDNIRRSTDIAFETAPDEFETSDIQFDHSDNRTAAFSELFDTRWESESNPEGSYRSEFGLAEAALPPSEPMTLIARWNLCIEPGEYWRLAWRACPWEQRPHTSHTSLASVHEQMESNYRDWMAAGTQVATSDEVLNRMLRRGLLDLRMLMWRTNCGEVPVAGLPWFDAVFGRDSLITGLQMLWIYPDLAVNILQFLAEHQAEDDDPWRDEEPGKIPHEIREGEMAATNEIPHGRYYGSVDGTLLFLILFGEAYRWLGPTPRLNSLVPAVEHAIAWIEEHGRSPEDGYVRWRARSPVGIRNQGWRDSQTSLRSLATDRGELSVALVEVQGYAYKAYRLIAEVMQGRNDALADKLTQWADELKVNFQRDFWMPDVGYPTEAFARNGEPSRAITSNGAQVLFSGILDPPQATRVVQRVMQSDLFNGWGIRTLSKDDPAFNPMSYHNGSVWFHDTALIAAGMRQYGFADESCILMRALFDAGTFLPRHPFPELICGFDRNDGFFSVPGDYPASCPIQAWSAGALFHGLQAMLGIRVANRGQRLYVSPKLPDWLKSIDLKNFVVGGNRIHLHFSRDERGNTAFNIMDNPNHVEVVVVS